MYKNYKLLIFLGAAIIFLYLSVGKYEEFSIEKSISACTIAKSKLQKELNQDNLQLSKDDSSNVGDYETKISNLNKIKEKG